jgi:hypothetical protein
MTDRPLHWYQFAGNLQDSMATGDKLSGSGAQPLQWVPAEGIYGLSMQTGDTCQLPPASFSIDENMQGGGRFLLRIKPLAEGTILTASFKAAGSGEDALTMSLAYSEGNLLLGLESGGLSDTGALPLGIVPEKAEINSGEYAAGGNFVTVAVDFYILENTLTASLSGGNAGSQPGDPVEIELSGPLNGKLGCRLGMAGDFALKPDGESKEPASSEARDGPYPLVIFDEFAVIPLLSHNG